MEISTCYNYYNQSQNTTPAEVRLSDWLMKGIYFLKLKDAKCILDKATWNAVHDA